MHDLAGGRALSERASATPMRALSRARGAAAPAQRDASATICPLGELERRMVEAIAGPESRADEMASLVTAGPRLSPRERLEIYRSGYRARLIECLLDDYPALADTLGSERFEQLGGEYIERFPSSSPSLNAFGRRMSELCRVAELPGFDAARGFLSELSALEWAVVEAIHARASSPLALEALQAIPTEAWGAARLVRSDTVRVLHFAYPVNAYYQACRTDGSPPPIPSSAPTATAVYRSGWRVFRMDLTPAMTRVLAALLEGLPIGEALARMGVDETDPAALAEAERSVMVWFREWIQGGFFSSVIAP